MKKIYIILSHSGSIPSRFVKTFTHFKYSHVSISLKSNINIMYSFGRKKLNNPLNGGFIIENKKGPFYKKFKNTQCLILEIEVTNVEYKKLINELKKYKDKIDIYKYDIFGVVLSIFNIKLDRKKHSMCSQFVGDLLSCCGIYNFNKKIIRPIDFMDLPNKKIIYEGKLLKY